MEKDLKIRTVGVQINIVTVDGKKMTKSVFSQILYSPCFDSSGVFKGDEILGFVQLDSRWLIWVKDGLLRKTELKTLYYSEYTKGYDLKNCLNIYDYLSSGRLSRKIYFDDSYDLAEDDLHEVRSVLSVFKDNYNDFFKSLEKLQIFIAI